MMADKPCKTLIEVALPLPEINDASAYDKMQGIGPQRKTNHEWTPMNTNPGRGRG